MKIEALISLLSNNEKLLEKCFIEMAMALPQYSSKLIEIARKHRENKKILDSIGDQTEITVQEIPSALLLDLFPGILKNLEKIAAPKPEILVESVESHKEAHKVLLKLSQSAIEKPSNQIRTDAQPKSVISCSDQNRIVSTKKGMKGCKKSKKTNLQVVFENGPTIQRETARDAFVESLVHMGIKRAKHLGFTVCKHPLIAEERSEIPNYAAQQAKCEDFFIFTRTSTEVKKKLLEKIARRLGFRMQITILTS